MEENKVRIWIVREKCGSLSVHKSKPIKGSLYWEGEGYLGIIDKNAFSSIRWEDSKPTEAFITLEEPKPIHIEEDPKWEQRRYEAAKDLYVHYRDLELSIDCANMLIDKLKKQSKL